MIFTRSIFLKNESVHISHSFRTWTFFDGVFKKQNKIQLVFNEQCTEWTWPPWHHALMGCCWNAWLPRKRFTLCSPFTPIITPLPWFYQYQCCGSMPLTNRSGSGFGFVSESCYFRHCYWRRQQKNFYYFLKVHLHNFSKIKNPKKVTKLLESRFFLIFLLDERRIRIRIQEAEKHTDPTDPDSDQDPQHCQ